MKCLTKWNIKFNIPIASFPALLTCFLIFSHLIATNFYHIYESASPIEILIDDISDPGNDGENQTKTEPVDGFYFTLNSSLRQPHPSFTFHHCEPRFELPLNYLEIQSPPPQS